MARKPSPKLPEPPEGFVNAVVISDHIFLPVEHDAGPDADGVWHGNVRPDWQDVPGSIDDLIAGAGITDPYHPGAKNKLREFAKKQDPRAVPKRARLAMPLELAELLEARDQVEII